MSASITRETGEAVQQQWVESEFNQTIQTQIFKTIEFLNQFDRAVSSRLSTLDQRIEYLDKKVGYLEYALRPID
jgi:hypothetical protein